jgi:hypothetical protein
MLEPPEMERPEFDERDFKAEFELANPQIFIPD